MAKFSDMDGDVIRDIVISDGKDSVTFHLESGREFVMLHEDDCCESVILEDVCGDPEDLRGAWVIDATEVTNANRFEEGNQTMPYADPSNPSGEVDEDDYYIEPESYTWTFYKLDTTKGSITLRWYGTSNGYYSESVSFMEAVEL